jgi:hypothetical protein
MYNQGPMSDGSYSNPSSGMNRPSTTSSMDSMSSIPCPIEIEHIKAQIVESDNISSNASTHSNEKKVPLTLKITEGFVSLCCKD